MSYVWYGTPDYWEVEEQVAREEFMLISKAAGNTMANEVCTGKTCNETDEEYAKRVKKYCDHLVLICKSVVNAKKRLDDIVEGRKKALADASEDMKKALNEIVKEST